jgi:cell division septation protein DedD
VEASPPSVSRELLETADIEDIDDDIDEYSPSLLEQAEEAAALADETDSSEEAPFETLHREPETPPAPVKVFADPEPSVRVFDEPPSHLRDDKGPEPGQAFARSRSPRRSPLLVVLLSALIVGVLGALALGVVAFREGKLDPYLARLGLVGADSTEAALPVEAVETRDALAELADSLEAVGAAVRHAPALDEPPAAVLEPDIAAEPRNDAGAANAEAADFFANVIDTTRVERPGVRSATDAPAPAPDPVVAGTYPDLIQGRFYIHVGSLKTLDHAEMLADSFHEKGHPVAIRATLISSQEWFRVYVGPYDSEAEAQRVQIDIHRLRLLQDDWSQIVRIR